MNLSLAGNSQASLDNSSSFCEVMDRTGLVHAEVIYPFPDTFGAVKKVKTFLDKSRYKKDEFRFICSKYETKIPSNGLVSHLLFNNSLAFDFMIDFSISRNKTMFEYNDMNSEIFNKLRFFRIDSKSLTSSLKSSKPTIITSRDNSIYGVIAPTTNLSIDILKKSISSTKTL